MSVEQGRPPETATGWARLPRWQHAVLIAFCAFALVAAAANTIAASTGRNRLLHGAFGVIVAVLLITLITSVRRRPRP